MVVVRQHKNSISSLTNSNGEKLTLFAEISNEVVIFFKKLIGTEDAKVIGCSRSLIIELFAVYFPKEVHLALTRSVTAEEVNNLMFSITGDKAPGPDGYTS